MNDPERLLDSLLEIAREAGRTTLEWYGKETPVEWKADDSPLTLADRAAHVAIVRALPAVLPSVPIVSEESDPAQHTAEGLGDLFWLVDPLDGTKEFIKQSGEFTLNIALVHEKRPVAGVVHVPVTGTSWIAWCPPRSAPGEGEAWAHRVEKDGRRSRIRTRRANMSRLTVIASRDHAGPIVEAFIARLRGADTTSMGSSLKFCLVAEGRADFYPRIVPTMEWDTAAAHCVLAAAGGGVIDLAGHSLRYAKEELRNPSFLAFGDPDVDWARVFSD